MRPYARRASSTRFPLRSVLLPRQQPAVRRRLRHASWLPGIRAAPHRGAATVRVSRPAHPSTCRRPGAVHAGTRLPEYECSQRPARPSWRGPGGDNWRTSHEGTRLARESHAPLRTMTESTRSDGFAQWRTPRSRVPGDDRSARRPFRLHRRARHERAGRSVDGLRHERILFAVASVAVGRLAFNDGVPTTTWVGLVVILAGSLIIHLGRT